MNDTVFYIVVFLVIAHFVAGFIFLVRKLSGPVKDERSEIRGQKSEVRNQRPEIRDQRSETRNQKLEIKK